MASYAVTDFEGLKQIALQNDDGRLIKRFDTEEELNSWIAESFASQKGYRYIGDGLYVSGKPTEAIKSGDIMSYNEEYYIEGEGVRKADAILTIKETETGFDVVTSGTSICAPGDEVIYSVVNALGIQLNWGVSVEELARNIAEDVFHAPHTTSWKDIVIFGIYKNGKTYVPESVIQGIANWLCENGYYDKGVVQENVPTSTGLTHIEIGSYNSTLISSAYFGFIRRRKGEYLVDGSKRFEIYADFLSKARQANFTFNTIAVSCSRHSSPYYSNIQYIILHAYNIPNEAEIKSDSLKPSFKYIEAPAFIVQYIFESEDTYRSHETYASNAPLPIVNKFYKADENYYGDYEYWASNLFISEDEQYIQQEVGVPMEDIIPPEYEIPINVKFIDWTDDAEPVVTPTEPIRYYPIKFPRDNDNQSPNWTGDSSDTNVYNYYYNINYVYPSDYNITESNMGDTPAPAPPTSATGESLFSIFNPTPAELGQLGQFLWSTSILDVIDNLKKLFENPMDSIISLHMCYFPVPFNEPQKIFLGNIDTGVTAKYVMEQYNELSLGFIDYKPRYGNIYDFEPYTTTQIYLPFIGIQHLNTADVLDGRIHITYRCDFLTGTCVADIEVERDDSKNLLYEFTGNLSVQIPLNGRSYSQTIGNFLGGAVNAMAGAFMEQPSMALKGIEQATIGNINSINVQRSGNFTANAGAMCIKTPYLIITRNIPYQPTNYNRYYGYPANTEALLSECYGYTRVQDVHVENISNATDAERAEIENLLKTGVIVNH